MPEVSPRRSSRARPVQPPPNKPAHDNSSSSSSSNKGDRSNKLNAPQEPSVTTPSNHSDETEQLEHGTRQTRRQKREQEAALDPKIETNVEIEEEEEDSEEDVTRCICGKLEYPGPPRPSGDRRDAIESQDPDAGGLFIQCDVCHVWQHGGCVGIMDEGATPDNYYCEQCKPSYHKIMTGGRASKYSRYVPIIEARSSDPSRKRASGKESESRSSKESDIKNPATHANGKRRSTMNSRAAYDEEEVFRRVLEESKGNNGTENSSNGNRKGKRAREETDDSEHELKRRKTGSDSPPVPSTTAADADSDNEPDQSRNRNGGGKNRSSRAQAEQERDFRRREKEREQERQAAANRRKGRADRRRADEPDDEQEPGKPPAPSKPAGSAPSKPSKSQASSRQQVVSPPRSIPANSSHKKAVRPTKKKVGRNQYTRDRDAAADVRAEAARTVHSRDGEDGHGDTMGRLLPNGSKPARPKHISNPGRTSMNELRKRAAGILEYISRTQVEMAGERTPSGTQTPSKSSSKAPVAAASSASGASKLSNVDNQDEVTGIARAEEGTVDSKVAMEKFKGMSALHMMDVLTREIVHWQQQHGKFGSRGDG